MKIRCLRMDINSFSRILNRTIIRICCARPNYICHLFVVSRKVIEKVGGLQKWVWRCTGLWFCVTLCGSSKGWRNLSYSKNPVSLALPWGLHRESREQALCLWSRKTCSRLTMREQESTQRFLRVNILGLYRTKFIRDHDPLISIIQNKDHIDDLKRCMESIEQKSTYCTMSVDYCRE